jgi:hypothetical protein
MKNYSTLLFTLLISCTSLTAQFNVWIGNNGDWSDASNWSTGAVPNTTETVRINSGSISITSGYVALAKKVDISPDGKLTITSGGRLTVEGAPGTTHGVIVEGTLNVSGILVVRDVSNGYGINVAGDGSFNVPHTGIVNIIDIDGMGIWNGSDVTSKGRIFIKNTTSHGIITYGNLYNAGGKISQLNIGAIGVYCYGGLLINNGELNIKGADAGMSTSQSGQMINEEDGQINISYTNTSAITISSGANDTFENYGLVNASRAITNHGFSSQGTIINHEGGEIILDEALNGIYNFSPSASVINEGSITLGDQISDAAIRNSGEINNLTCGRIFIKERVFNAPSGDINNEGWIFSNTPSNSSNFGTFDNNGVIEDNPNTLSPVVSNNGIIALPLTGTIQVGVPVNNALTLGSLAAYTVGGWYTNSNLSTLAGKYDDFQNTWLPFSAAQGLNEVFVLITHNASGCSEVVSIDIPGGVQPFSAPEIFGSSVGSQTTTAKFTTYPNPSNGQFNLKTPQNIEGACEIQIFHSTGQLVWQEMLELNGSHNLNLHSTTRLASGMYHLLVLQQGKMIWQDQICIIQ